MANIKAALKDIRQNAKHHLRNTEAITELRTMTKKFNKLVLEGQKETANSFLPQLVKKLDRVATKKMIHPNAAARKKSRLMKRLAALK